MCTVQQERFTVLAAVNGRLELLVALVIAAHEANLNQLPAGLDLRLYDALAGIGLGSQRLFAEHILACRDGSQNVLFMVRVCCGAHYSVDFRIVNHVDGIFKALDAVFLGNRKTKCACRIGTGYNLAALKRVVDAFNVGAADAAGAYQADFQFAHFYTFLFVLFRVTIPVS